MAANIEQSPFKLQHHVDGLYANLPRQLAFRATTAEEFAFWQQTLRTKVAELLGIDGRRVPVNPQAVLVQTVDRRAYIEEKYALDVGESVRAPMYVLVPKTAAPYKAVLGFHGHDPSI